MSSYKRSKVTVIISMPWVNKPPSSIPLCFCDSAYINIPQGARNCLSFWLIVSKHSRSDHWLVSAVVHSGLCLSVCEDWYSVSRPTTLLCIEYYTNPNIGLPFVVRVCMNMCAFWWVTHCESKSKRQGLSIKRQKGMCFPFHCQENGKI